jgi:hypothetical protein
LVSAKPAEEKRFGFQVSGFGNAREGKRFEFRISAKPAEESVSGFQVPGLANA